MGVKKILLSILLSCCFLNSFAAVSLDTIIDGRVIHAELLDVGVFRFFDIAAVPHLKGNELEFTNVEATLLGGTVTGKVFHHLQQGFTTCELQCIDIQLAKILETYGDIETSEYEGLISGTITLTIPRRGLSAMRGEIKLNLRKGSLLNLPLMASILVAEQNAVPGFDSGELHATIADNVITIDKIFIDNPSARVVGDGTVNLDGSLDLKFNPTVTGRGWRNIPIVEFVGVGLREISKGIVRVRVRGTLNEPIVQTKL